MHKMERLSASMSSMGIRKQNSRFISIFTLACILGFLGSLLVPAAYADTHTTGLPVLNSRPGAAYTLYLDFTGFNFTGTWNYFGPSPGNTPAFENASSSGTFTTAQQNDIKAVWARVAQSYTAFNINVTTVDPAVAAGQADTDAHRQAYYDQTAKLMHTVIGQQQNNWKGSYGGVSQVGVAENTYSTFWNSGAGVGMKTNWVFTDGVGTGLACGQASAHENGHGLGLEHQSDYTGSTKNNEYSLGDNNSGNGTYAPIMGAAYYTQRGAWRVGDASGAPNHYQNDIVAILGNSGMGGFIEDGIGHTMATATPLPLNGTSVNYNLAKGIIEPASTSNPQPIGVSNYTTDYFQFRSNGTTPISLTVNDGSEFLTPGVADPGAMLRSTLKILNSSGTVVVTANEAASTLSETFTGFLPAGVYYAQIASYGGKTQALSGYNASYFYDMGSYFVTGSGLFTVPEPATWAMLASVVCFGVVVRRWRKK